MQRAARDDDQQRRWVHYRVTVTGVGGRQSVETRAHFTSNETSNGVTPISHMDGICDWETYVCIDV